MLEPTIKVNFNQKFYIWLREAEGGVLPCQAHVGFRIIEIPDKSWITYKGYAQFLNKTYMRFEYDGEDVLVPFSALKYMWEVPHRSLGEKVKVPKSRFKVQSSNSPKFLLQKTSVTKQRKIKKKYKA